MADETGARYDNGQPLWQDSVDSLTVSFAMMAAKFQRRRPLLWPMIVGIVLNPICWPAMLGINLKGPHAGFTSTAWLTLYCQYLLIAAVLPAVAWLSASRIPFAALAVGGALLVLYWPFCMISAASMLVGLWEHFRWQDRAIGVLLAGQVLLFPFWLRIVWRVAMGDRG